MLIVNSSFLKYAGFNSTQVFSLLNCMLTVKFTLFTVFMFGCCLIGCVENGDVVTVLNDFGWLGGITVRASDLRSKWSWVRFPVGPLSTA